MADGGITAISLRGVRKLIDDKSIGESVLDVVDDLLGAIILLSSLGGGPIPLSLFEPKNQLVSIVRDAIKLINKPHPSGYLDQAARLAAANCLLTFTAYFDALDESLPVLRKKLRLSDKDKREIAAASPTRPAADDHAADDRVADRLPAEFPRGDLGDMVISLPHPAALEDARNVRLGIYKEMSDNLLRGLSRLGTWEEMPESGRKRVAQVVTTRIPDRACEVYDAEYLGMAIDFRQFFIWCVLRDQREKDQLIRVVDADLRTLVELIAVALGSVDVGMRNLDAAIREIAQTPCVPEPLTRSLDRIAPELHAGYEDEINRPIFDDRYGSDDAHPSYPTKVDAYVPQAYRVTRYTDGVTYLERDDEWNALPVHDDLGPFLMRTLESPYSIETPLLILGHPGSGKSLLTEMLAARLAYPQYTTVRVELRDVNPDADIQSQIEAQIRKDTGRDVNWADLADSLAVNPPVVILDGYDELLQATGKLFADYLEQVRRFQHREAVQHRPVRVIVTSRIALIDKAIVPSGATIVRLEEFNAERCQTWIRIWNDHNQRYFRHTGTQPFELPAPGKGAGRAAARKIVQLAKQPLLLLMLALYDADGNKLSCRPNIDQSLLYHGLLTRFIEREQSKTADRGAEIDGDRERLGIAAIGMFNRQDVKIRSDELDADLRYFGAGRGAAPDGGRRLSQADLLLGSFFFVHESRSRLTGDGGSPGPGPATGPAAFEFLHNTFGEFLTADFILRKVLAEANAICALSGDAALGDTLRQRLAIMSPGWFACLIHTPLHTRPNILSMLREWGGHRLSGGTRSRADLLTSLDMIVLAQLRSLLAQPALPNLPSAAAAGPDGATGARGETPYRPLPALGHLAVYSLNLVLLRCFLDDGAYALDEAALGAAGGRRPWDRLVSIWRSWFPLESLGALASLFTATREGTLIVTVPRRSELAIPTIPGVCTAYNVSVALADDLTAASAGVSVASATEIPERFLPGLRARTQDEVPELAPVMDSLQLRMFGADRPDDLAGHAQGKPLFSAATLKTSPYVLGILEAADRTMVTPRPWARIPIRQPGLADLISLSRYEAELAVHARHQLEPRWLPHLLYAGSSPGTEKANEWRAFLLSPAAAPVLRTALRDLSPGQCADFARHYTAVTAARNSRAATPAGTPGTGGQFDACDVDTATAFAALCWRGGAAKSCAGALAAVVRECDSGAWSLLDVAAATWGYLADLFVTADPPAEAIRAPFTAALNMAVRESLGTPPDRGEVNDMPSRALGEFWIHALRIGASENRDKVLARMKGMRSRSFRSWTLLLMRWAHESNDRGLARELFGGQGLDDWPELLHAGSDGTRGELDTEQISMGLTYREATDLRWVLDVVPRSAPRSTVPPRRRPARNQQPRN